MALERGILLCDGIWACGDAGYPVYCRMAEISLGLSFDDVLLVPALSSILPGEAELATQLTGDISLRLPVISAAMDTVSEHDLAIALAREGGMGVIHRACPIEEQAAMVSKVMRSCGALRRRWV